MMVENLALMFTITSEVNFIIKKYDLSIDLKKYLFTIINVILF